MHLEQLAQTLHRASRTIAGGIKRIESRIPEALKDLPISRKLDALEAISDIHQGKQMLTSDILGKLGGNNGIGQKARSSQVSGAIA